jgi:hypothetical protein
MKSPKLIKPSMRRLLAATLCLLSVWAHGAGRQPIPEYPAAPISKPNGPINIDLGRQLFVDDYLIEETTLKRTFHQAKIHDGPVLKAETPLELNGGTAEGAVLFDGGVWTGLTANKALQWLKPNPDDQPDPEFNVDPELYKFGAVAYESIMLGAAGMFYGPQNDEAKELKRPKLIDLQLAYSRDGVGYPRPSREAFIACARKPGAWNRGYLHSANGVCCNGPRDQ